MFTGLRQLCALSLLCGAALTMTPSGGVKRVTEVVCTAVLALSLLSPLRGIDLESYALGCARYNEARSELLKRAGETEERLNRLVIEREYSSYIMDKAKNLGITLSEARVRVQWSLDGLWVPYAAELASDCGDGERMELGRIILDDLGIPYERQQWN